MKNEIELEKLKINDEVDEPQTKNEEDDDEDDEEDETITTVDDSKKKKKKKKKKKTKKSANAESGIDGNASKNIKSEGAIGFNIIIQHFSHFFLKDQIYQLVAC
jgi:hypothetical protein